MNEQHYSPILVMDTEGFSAEEFASMCKAISAYTGGVSIGGSDLPLPLYEAEIDRLPLSFYIRVIVCIVTVFGTALAIAYNIV